MAKEIINVTDIIEYLYCPRKVYLRRVKKIKTPPNKAMILGFLKHKIFDIFNKNESSIVSSIKEPLTKEQISIIYKEFLEAIIREITKTYENMIKTFDVDKQQLAEKTLSFLKKDIHLRIDSVKKYLELGFLGKELWRNLKPKYLTEFEIISPTLGLKGRVDRILLSDNIVPYEIKTREEVYESDKLQLAAYSLLLEQEFEKKIEKGVVETGKNLQEIEITKEMKEKVLEIADKIRGMKEASFLNNFNKCKSCRMREECFKF